jgi:hypothetical protein
MYPKVGPKNIKTTLMRKFLRKRPLGRFLRNFGVYLRLAFGKWSFRMELNRLRSRSNGQPQYYQR